MTLAELFLLLLMVGWYGMRLESEPPGPDPRGPDLVPRVELVNAEARAEKAEKELGDSKRQVREHERILEWLQGHFGGGPVLDLGQLQEAEAGHHRDVEAEARRGRPACQMANVLVRVVADGEEPVLTLLEEFREDDQGYAKGSVIRGESPVAEFLARVRSYYAKRKALGRDCAFDYELVWRSDRDYRASRQQFERYFYPARLTQLQ